MTTGTHSRMITAICLEVRHEGFMSRSEQISFQFFLSAYGQFPSRLVIGFFEGAWIVWRMPQLKTSRVSHATMARGTWV